jgi:hypothetical protein
LTLISVQFPHVGLFQPMFGAWDFFKSFSICEWFPDCSLPPPPYENVDSWLLNRFSKSFLHCSMLINQSLWSRWKPAKQTSIKLSTPKKRGGEKRYIQRRWKDSDLSRVQCPLYFKLWIILLGGRLGNYVVWWV